MPSVPPKIKDEQFIIDLCENTHDLIQSFTPNGSFLYVNKAWIGTLGYQRGELSAINLFDLLNPKEHQNFRQALKQLSQERESVHIQTEMKTKQGRLVTLEGSLFGQRRKDILTSVHSILQDNTKIKEAGDELDRLFNLSLDLLCVAGIDGFFKHTNPAFERVLGYSQEELLSQSFLDFVHPEDREKTIAEVQRLSKGLPVVDFQNRYRAKNGSYKWLAWRSAPFAERGLIYAVARDITEQKQLEDLMQRQTIELQRSNADLEQFAYVASHDLQTPLRSIENLSHWIEEDMPAEIPSVVTEHLGKLRSQVNRMEDLISDLLLYARAGEKPGKQDIVDTQAVIEDLNHLLAPSQGFKIRCETGMPVFKTTRSPLVQVFRNLINNSLKHHDMATGEIVVSCKPQEKFFEFTVRDDGPGIPIEAREQVFLMFQKLDTERNPEGTGIGLALVKKIVEDQGGQVSIEPVENRGTVMRFTWPKSTE
jgi:PAS domain S-box-containing protein